jgi:hypothetical protein
MIAVPKFFDLSPVVQMLFVGLSALGPEFFKVEVN